MRISLKKQRCLQSARGQRCTIRLTTESLILSASVPLDVFFNVLNFLFNNFYYYPFCFFSSWALGYSHLGLKKTNTVPWQFSILLTRCLLIITLNLSHLLKPKELYHFFIIKLNLATCKVWHDLNKSHRQRVLIIKISVTLGDVLGTHQWGTETREEILCREM